MRLLDILPIFTMKIFLGVVVGGGGGEAEKHKKGNSCEKINNFRSQKRKKEQLIMRRVKCKLEIRLKNQLKPFSH